MQLEVRAMDAEKLTIGGRAIVFNSMSENLGWFREIIKPEAMNGVLERSTDVVALFNHDVNMILGRTTSSTLRLLLTDDGLDYEVDLPETRKDVYESIARGDVRQSSFGFTIAPKGEEWEQDEEGKNVRNITQIQRLYDVSPVTYPAYGDTSVAKRSFEEWVEASKEENHEAFHAWLDREERIREMFF